MVLRLLAANAEHWLARQLNAYLEDPNEYRATTRNLLHLGGTITYTPDAINVALDLLTTPKITRALSLLTEQLNTNPPRTPGGPAPSPTPSPDDQRSTVAATRLPDVWDRVEEDDLLRGGDRRLLSALSPRDRVW